MRKVGIVHNSPLSGNDKKYADNAITSWTVLDLVFWGFSYLLFAVGNFCNLPRDQVGTTRRDTLSHIQELLVHRMEA